VLVTHDPELARRAQRNVHVVDGQISDLKAYEPRSGTAVQQPGSMHASSY
jgi:putative ABC transport system ATP-binding protein